MTTVAIDIIRISKDRKTLEFTIYCGPHTDQFRVLEQSDTQAVP